MRRASQEIRASHWLMIYWFRNWYWIRGALDFLYIEFVNQFALYRISPFHPPWYNCLYKIIYYTNISSIFQLAGIFCWVPLLCCQWEKISQVPKRKTFENTNLLALLSDRYRNLSPNKLPSLEQWGPQPDWTSCRPEPQNPPEFSTQCRGQLSYAKKTQLRASKAP